MLVILQEQYFIKSKLAGKETIGLVVHVHFQNPPDSILNASRQLKRLILLNIFERHELLQIQKILRFISR
jgi:hypothetical protein